MHIVDNFLSPDIRRNWENINEEAKKLVLHTWATSLGQGGWRRRTCTFCLIFFHVVSGFVSEVKEFYCHHCFVVQEFARFFQNVFCLVEVPFYWIQRVFHGVWINLYCCICF